LVVLLALHVGNTDEEYRRAVMADAVTKLSHYRKTAAATSHLEPRVTTYMDHKAGGFQAAVQERHSQGQLNLKAVMSTPSNNAAGRDPAPEEADAEQCSASLHCARPSAASSSSANQMCDIMGVMGWCCAHGIPLRSLFCDLLTNEQFCYYLLSLEQLVSQGNQLDVYIDFGCRLKATWERYKSSRDIHLQDSDVRILVNWMHGASHEMSCQLQNCGRYLEDAGWRIGEQLEQLWSLLKV
jgi:hypothetical protein